MTGLFNEGFHSFKNCQAQGPTPGPDQGLCQGQGQNMVRSWSGQERSGQVRSGQTLTPTPTPKWELSYVYTKIGFHHHPPTTPSLNECLERRPKIVPG